MLGLGCDGVTDKVEAEGAATAAAATAPAGAGAGGVGVCDVGVRVRLPRGRRRARGSESPPGHGAHAEGSHMRGGRSGHQGGHGVLHKAVPAGPRPDPPVPLPFSCLTPPPICMHTPYEQPLPLLASIACSNASALCEVPRKGPLTHCGAGRGGRRPAARRRSRG
jgi:hypothetical protein